MYQIIQHQSIILNHTTYKASLFRFSYLNRIHIRQYKTPDEKQFYPKENNFKIKKRKSKQNKTKIKIKQKIISNEDMIYNISQRHSALVLSIYIIQYKQGQITFTKRSTQNYHSSSLIVIQISPSAHPQYAYLRILYLLYNNQILFLQKKVDLLKMETTVDQIRYPAYPQSTNINGDPQKHQNHPANLQIIANPLGNNYPFPNPHQIQISFQQPPKKFLPPYQVIDSPFGGGVMGVLPHGPIFCKSCNQITESYQFRKPNCCCFCLMDSSIHCQQCGSVKQSNSGCC